MRQIASFLELAVNHVLAGLPIAPPEEQSRRLAICQACDQFDPTATRCKQCGCFLILKASWAEQQCPLQKWEISQHGSS